MSSARTTRRRSDDLEKNKLLANELQSGALRDTYGRSDVQYTLTSTGIRRLPSSERSAKKRRLVLRDRMRCGCNDKVWLQ